MRFFRKVRVESRGEMQRGLGVDFVGMLGSPSTIFRGKSDAGFTLMEIVIVFMIIGVLATIMMSGTLLSSRLRGRDTVRKSDLSQIARALEMYANDYGVYPDVDGNGRIMGCGTEAASVACEWNGEFRDANGTLYMARIPQDSKDPVYSYVYQSNQTAWQLYARLENEKDPVLDTDGDRVADVDYGMACGTDGNCNYGISSGNTTPGAVLP